MMKTIRGPAELWDDCKTWFDENNRKDLIFLEYGRYYFKIERSICYLTTYYKMGVYNVFNDLQYGVYVSKKADFEEKFMFIIHEFFPSLNDYIDYDGYWTRYLKEHRRNNYV